MKFNILIVILLILKSCFICAQHKPTLAVMRLDSKNIPGDELEILSNRLQSELYRTKKFILLERMKIKAVMEELGFQQTGFININRAIKVGNMLGAEKIVFGNLDKVGNIYSADLRLVDVATSRIENIAEKNFNTYGIFDFMVSHAMENIARTLANQKIEKNYEKIASKMYEASLDPGFCWSFGLSVNKNADGNNHINNGGYMKSLLGLSLSLESTHPGFGGFAGFNYYFWEQWYEEWDNIMEFDFGCHYTYKIVRVFAGLDCHFLFIQNPETTEEEVWNFEFMGTNVFPFIFGYEYGAELFYRVGFLTDVFIRYKHFSYFDDLESKGIRIGDNSFGTFMFGVKFVL